MSTPKLLIRSLFLVPILGLLAVSAFSQQVREVRRAIVVGDDGEVIEMRGEGDGESMRWFQNGEEVGHGEHSLNVFTFSDENVSGSGYLGVELTELTDALRDHFGVPRGRGVMVGELVDGAPAQAAGVRIADIITSVNGESVSGSRDLSRLIRALEDGQVADLELWRDGKLVQLSASVAERERGIFKIGENGTFRIEVGGESEADVNVLYDDLHSEAVVKVREFLGSNEWRARIDSIEDLDFETLQKRMREVERQLIEIEVRLKDTEQDAEEDGEPDGDGV